MSAPATTAGPRYVVVPCPETGVSRIVRQDGTPLVPPGTLAASNLPPPALKVSMITQFHRNIMAQKAEREARAAAAPTSPTKPSLGRRLRPGEVAPTQEALIAWRKRLGLGQRELAAALGVSRGRLADIECGRWQPSVEVLAAVGDVLLRLEREQGQEDVG